MEELLGAVPDRGSSYVTRTWVRDTLSAHYAMASALYTPTQAARLCMLLIVGCSFWHTRRDTIDLSILRSLEDMAVVEEYNWGGAMLCTMYREMSDLSRGAVTSLGGTYVIWEVHALSLSFFFFTFFFFASCGLFAISLSCLPPLMCTSRFYRSG